MSGETHVHVHTTRCPLTSDELRRAVSDRDSLFRPFEQSPESSSDVLVRGHGELSGRTVKPNVSGTQCSPHSPCRDSTPHDPPSPSAITIKLFIDSLPESYAPACRQKRDLADPPLLSCRVQDLTPASVTRTGQGRVWDSGSEPASVVTNKQSPPLLDDDQKGPRHASDSERHASHVRDATVTVAPCW